MKHYFLINTTDNERDSSYKKICDTLDEAKKEVPNFANWYCSKGTCDIHEVDENFNIYKVYHFRNGLPAGIIFCKENYCEN